MILNLKKIAGGLILIIGIILFFSSLLQQNLNFALVSLTSALIFWVLFGLLLDTFDVQMFSWVISTSGLLLSIAVFFLYGIEEVAHPVGAIVFHSSGIAGSLGIFLVSLFPILIIYQINSQNNINWEFDKYVNLCQILQDTTLLSQRVLLELQNHSLDI